MAGADSSTFDWRELACPDEQTAAAEARRQQQHEDPEAVEWIYLRNNAGHWVARRTPRHHVEEPPRMSFRRALLDEVIRNLDLESVLPSIGAGRVLLRRPTSPGGPSE